MFPNDIEDDLQKLARSFIRASTRWLLLGVLSGIILALNQRFPHLLKEFTILPIHRTHFYHAGILIFGWCLPLCFGLWLTRLRELHTKPLRGLLLWEAAHWIWHSAMVWGVVAAFFGQHGELPIFVWMPVIYGCLMVASLLILIGIVINRPAEISARNGIAYQFLLIGSIALTLLFLFFLALPIAQKLFPAFIHTLIGMGILFPTIGLVLSHRSDLYTKIQGHVAAKLFLWLAIIFWPLSALTFSAKIYGCPLLVIAHLFILLSSIMLVISLRDPQPDPDAPIGRLFNLQFSGHSAHFLAYGAICLLLALGENTIFAALRTQDVTPSPTWLSTNYHLLLAGCILFWLQAVVYQYLAQHDKIPQHTKIQAYILLIGVILFAIGGWLESIQYLHLELLDLSRGTIAANFARSLRLLGGIAIAINMLNFASTLRKNS
jgi:hypothetical protein